MPPTETKGVSAASSKCLLLPSEGSSFSPYPLAGNCRCLLGLVRLRLPMLRFALVRIAWFGVGWPRGYGLVRLRRLKGWRLRPVQPSRE